MQRICARGGCRYSRSIFNPQRDPPALPLRPHPFDKCKSMPLSGFNGRNQKIFNVEPHELPPDLEIRHSSFDMVRFDKASGIGCDMAALRGRRPHSLGSAGGSLLREPCVDLLDEIPWSCKSTDFPSPGQPGKGRGFRPGTADAVCGETNGFHAARESTEYRHYCPHRCRQNNRHRTFSLLFRPDLQNRGSP